VEAFSIHHVSNIELFLLSLEMRSRLPTPTLFIFQV